MYPTPSVSTPRNLTFVFGCQGDVHPLMWAAAVWDQDPEFRNDVKTANNVVAALSPLYAHAAEGKLRSLQMYWIANLHDKKLW